MRGEDTMWFCLANSHWFLSYLRRGKFRERIIAYRIIGLVSIYFMLSFATISQNPKSNKIWPVRINFAFQFTKNVTTRSKYHKTRQLETCHHLVSSCQVWCLFDLVIRLCCNTTVTTQSSNLKWEFFLTSDCFRDSD